MCYKSENVYFLTFFNWRLLHDTKVEFLGSNWKITKTNCARDFNKYNYTKIKENVTQEKNQVIILTLAIVCLMVLNFI